MYVMCGRASDGRAVACICQRAELAVTRRTGDTARYALDPGCGRASDRFRWVGEKVGRAVSGAGCPAVVWRRIHSGETRRQAQLR